MYAIVDIAGQQIKVEKNQRIYVHLLDGDTGAPVHFNRVLLIDNDKNILIGNPLLSDALITGKILSHVKGDKIKVFKKKRRKGFKVLKGHRQFYTEVQIEEILEKGGSKILKDLVTKIEVKKSLKTEKPKKTAKPVTHELKTSAAKHTETSPEEEISVDKSAKLSESKPKKSPVKTTGKKPSATSKASKSKTKSESVTSDKTDPGTAAKKKASEIKKATTAKKSDKKEKK